MENMKIFAAWMYLAFLHACVIIHTVRLPFFFGSYFLKAVQCDDNSNKVYVIGQKYIWPLQELILTLVYWPGLKGSDSGLRHINAHDHRVYFYKKK